MTDAIRGNASEAGADRLRWTSVPRWPAPELPAAASYLACGFGDAGERAFRALLAEADPAVPVRTAVFAAHWDPAAEAGLRRLVGDSRTGVRIILAGPESMVLRAAAVARQRGAASEELVLVATESAGQYVAGPAARRVFCAACRAPFDARAALGEVVTCPGCQAGLIVDCRFSRPHAAYFGWPARPGRPR
ncbi:MAG TPA: dimethylamine monooxygenase subunit DmmA family protein [Trebonia sp.]